MGALHGDVVGGSPQRHVEQQLSALCDARLLVRGHPQVDGHGYGTEQHAGVQRNREVEPCGQGDRHAITGLRPTRHELRRARGGACAQLRIGALAFGRLECDVTRTRLGCPPEPRLHHHRHRLAIRQKHELERFVREASLVGTECRPQLQLRDDPAMRSASALAVVAMAFVLGSCGSNETPGTAHSTAANARTSVSDAFPHPRLEVQHAISQCKLGVKASTQIASKAKPELESACDAGNQGLEGPEARKVTIGVCREVAFLARSQSKRAKDRAFAACWAIAGKK
ncbi:MAG TPA: hypothetical protein VN817_10945 [Solirubrobacteraceae bacterium]|nr:hypothetical protein [Solirubrobacteraceae bacterium]